MTMDLIWKGLLALVGCFAAAYVALDVAGGGAPGWAAGGAILAGTCGPLFSTLIDRRRPK